MQKWLKILLIVLGSIIVFLGLLTIFLGPIAEKVIEKHSKEICHRVVTMDKLRVNMFTGGVGVYGFKALEEDDKTVFLSFKSLEANINAWALIAKRVKLSYIRLNDPVVRVTQRDSIFNFTDIIEFFKPEEPDTTPSDWEVILNDISLQNGDVSYSDLVLNSNFRMKDVDIEVPQICFGKGNSDVALRLLFDHGGELDVKMGYGMEKSDFNVFLTLRNFNLKPTSPYLKKFVSFSQVEGKLSADLTLSGDMNHIIQFDAKGNVTLQDFDISTEEYEHVAAFDRFSVDVDTINVDKLQMCFEKVELDGLRVNFEMTKKGNSISSLLANDTSETETDKNKAKTPADQEVKSEEAASPNPDILIRHLVLNNCAVNFTDHTLKTEQMSLPVTNIRVDAHNVSTSSQSKVDLYAHFGKTGEFICRWNGSLSLDKNQSIDVEIKDLQMKELSPYCKHYFAYPISKGVLGFKSVTHLKNGGLDSKNYLDMYNLIIDKKIKTIKPEYKIPLQAAAYVLTDMSGRVKLDLPVKGDLKNPEFSLKNTIVKLFLNTMLKVVASPVDMILKACRANANVFNDMPLELNQPVILSRQYDQMNEMCEVLKQKPDLTVIITPSFNVANYNPKAEDQTATLAAQANYERLKAMFLEHFAKYGISGEHVRFSDEVGKKIVPTDKMIWSFDLQTPGMDDEEGMASVAEEKLLEESNEKE